MQFMQISVAVHYSAYFGLGILYCIYKGRIDAILLRYKYGMFLGSFALSASLLPWKLVAALVGIVFSLILSLIVEKRSGVGLIHLSTTPILCSCFLIFRRCLCADLLPMLFRR